MTKSILWTLMTLLALLIAAYALGVALVPMFRTPLINDIFTQTPFAALGHFLGGGLSLVFGALQLNSRLRQRFLHLHRWIGRGYLFAVVAGGVAALNLAVNSTAGFAAQVGFGSLGVCWIASTMTAYYFIRQGDHKNHQVWMFRSYALTLAAVTLRIYLPLSAISGIPFETAYIAISWFAWVPNLIVVEWIILPNYYKKLLPA